MSQRRVKGGEPRLKAPKAEYFLLDANGRRPHYKWVQLNDFDHAGEPMPPILQELCERLNATLALSGDDRFNHCLIICNEQSGDGPHAHCAPPHADKIQKGYFVDLSLGYPRALQLIDPSTKDIVASQLLASGSLVFVTAEDNGRLVQGRMQDTRYLHAVPKDPKQPKDQPRFSIVFRPITDHPKNAKCGEHLAEVDEEKAARVRPDGDLWRVRVHPALPQLRSRGAHQTPCSSRAFFSCWPFACHGGARIAGSSAWLTYLDPSLLLGRRVGAR